MYKTGECRERSSLREAVLAELLLQSLNEFGARAMLLIPLLEVKTLLNACITADGGDIDHAISAKYMSQHEAPFRRNEEQELALHSK